MTRIERLMIELDWSQHVMGAYVGLSQPVLSRMIARGVERPAVAKLLDMLEAEIAEKGVAAVKAAHGQAMVERDSPFTPETVG